MIKLKEVGHPTFIKKSLYLYFSKEILLFYMLPASHWIQFIYSNSTPIYHFHLYHVIFHLAFYLVFTDYIIL